MGADMAIKSVDPDIRLLQALADPARLEIVRQLGRCDVVCACDFTDCCGVSQPTISHHLRVLREAGIVESERRGTFIYYSLAKDFPDRFAAIGASVRGLVGIGSATSR